MLFRSDQLHAKEQAWTNGVAPQVNPGVYLFSSNPNAKPIPEKFSSAPLGFSEINIDNRSYFLYRENA